MQLVVKKHCPRALTSSSVGRKTTDERNKVSGQIMKNHRRELLMTGYTLVEVVAVIGIILFGAVASLSAVTYSLRVITLSGERLEAAMLAQEGLEVVRNIRDNNWIQNPPQAFDNNINGSPPPQYYLISFESPGFSTPALNISDPTPDPSQVQSLYFDESTGRYGYKSSQFPSWPDNTLPESSKETKFKRYVAIEKKIDTVPDPDADYLKVTSWVYWGQSFNQFVAVTTYLYDWRP